MPWTILASDPLSGAVGLLVEVHAEGGAIGHGRRAFEERMFAKGIRIGLMIDPQQAVVVSDSLSTMDFATNRFDTLGSPVATAALFLKASIGEPRSGEAFIGQVERWLRAISESWHDSLADEAIEAMVPEVSAHVAGADFERVDGLLEVMTAAE